MPENLAMEEIYIYTFVKKSKTNNKENSKSINKTANIKQYNEELQIKLNQKCAVHSKRIKNKTKQEAIEIIRRQLHVHIRL